jgi:hypothetical protein
MTALNKSGESATIGELRRELEAFIDFLPRVGAERQYRIELLIAELHERLKVAEAEAGKPTLHRVK